MPILLVIDDDPGVRYAFRRVLEGDGVTVLTASTAAEGLARICESRPDIVVLDLQLPDRSGLELLREIKACEPGLPVIFITAHGTAETGVQAMQAGAFDYLAKPVNLRRLSEVLEQAFAAAH